MPMELIIYSPQEDGFLKEITFNHEEIKNELAERLKKYQNLVYSGENIKSAKSDRANLNAFKNALEDRRIQIKKQCLEPYEEFERKIKDLVAMIDKPVQAIDTQIKNYEQLVKDEKKTGIKLYFDDKVGNLASLITFEKIFNDKWLNATYKSKDIEKEITDLFIKVESDLRVITELQSEHEINIKDVYLKAFDLTASLQEKTRLEEQAAKLAEHKRQQEEAKVRAKQAYERNQASSGTVSQTPIETNVKPVEAGQAEFEMKPANKPVAEQLTVIDFRVWATKDQLNALKQFLVSNGIRYGKVPTQQ